jgi:hypothetical protein
MSDAFKIPAEMLPMALKAHAKGTKDFDKFCTAAAGLLVGGTSAKVKAAFETVRIETERTESFKGISKNIAGIKVPKTMLKVLQEAHEHIVKFTVTEKKDGDKVITKAFTPRIRVEVEYTPAQNVGTKEEIAATAKFTAVEGRITARTKGGTKSGKSRISAYVAYERGVKAGDKFKVEKCDGGYKFYAVGSTVGRFVKKGKLTELFIAVVPESFTVGILKDYGQAG